PSGLRLKRGAAPESAAESSRSGDGPLPAGRRIQISDAHVRGVFGYILTGLRRNIRRLKTLRCKRRWLQREGLRGPGFLASDVGGGHGPLLNREQWLSGFPVEHEGESLFRDLDNRVLPLGSGEYGRGRAIVIPKVVMDDLIVPAALAGGGVERDHAVGKQVLSEPISAVEIECRRSGA